MALTKVPAGMVAVAPIAGLTATNAQAALAELTASGKASLDAAAVLSGETSDQLEATGSSLIVGAGVLIEAFGDSTFWGADPANLAAAVSVPSPQALQNFLGLFYGTTSTTVSNRAVSGTNVNQMIDGSDGSGSTFAAKMAASTATVVMCNHGVNNATGSVETTPTAYKAGMVSFVKTCRKYGKTPVLVTPYPSYSFGVFGSVYRAERQRLFAQVMRGVAEEFGVALVDNHAVLEGLLRSGKYRPLDLLPDAVHGGQSTYFKMGHNLARPLIGAVRPLSGPDQFAVCASGCVIASSQVTSPDSSSRVGAVVATSGAGTRSLRMVFDVTEPGLDLYLAYPMWDSGSTAVNCSMDGVLLGVVNMFSAGYTSAVGYVQDHEVLVAKNVDVGYHILHLDCTSGGIGAFYLRTRRSVTRGVLLNASAVPVVRKLLAQELALESTVPNTIVLRDDMPCSRLLEDAEFEFTAKLQNDSGLCINGFNFGTNGGTALASQGIIIAMGGAGSLCVYEATSPSTFASTTLDGATNYTAASHKYRVVVTRAFTGANNCGTVTVYVDGVQVGPVVALTRPYFGGFVGLWKNNAGASPALVISNLVQVLR